MKTKKQLLKESLALKLVVITLGLFVVGGTVKAVPVGFWEMVAEKVSSSLVSQILGNSEEEVLGASGTRFPHGLSADTTSPLEGEVRGTTLTVTGDSSLSGNLTVASDSYFIHGSEKSIVTSGTFANATTTVFCELSPFSATSTVDLASFQYTGISTTSVAIIFATSTASTGLTTSTVGFLTTNNSSQLLQVNLLANTTATNTIFHGGILPDSLSGQNLTTATRINVRPNEYVCGVIGEGNGGSTTGVTNPLNLFAGTYSLRWLGY